MIKVRLTTQENDKEYYLLGAGYGVTKPIPRGSLFPFQVTEQDSHRLICLCDETGTIHWAHSKHVKVVSIDGVELNG